MADKDFVVKNGIVVSGNVTLSNTSAIIANNSPGSNGQVLTSNGSAAYWSSSAGGGSSITINQLDDITSQFDGYKKEFPISYDGTSYSPSSPFRMNIWLGGVYIRPSKYYEDYVNLPDIPVFEIGFVIKGSNIVFSAPPVQLMSFYGTVDTGTTQYPTFKYNTSIFKPLAIMTGTD